MSQTQPPASPPQFPNAVYDVVAFAASAGGITALKFVLSTLPEDFPAAIVAVQHLAPRHQSLLADILSRATGLRVKDAEEKERLQPGTVYMAPTDHHLLVNMQGTLSLTQSELVHFVRPSADLLFESVAASYRERAIAVVLSGTGIDGSIGVQAIKKMHGTVIVQDAGTAEFSGMPSAAIQTQSADFILPLAEIAAALVRLVVRQGRPHE